MKEIFISGKGHILLNAYESFLRKNFNIYVDSSSYLELKSRYSIDSKFIYNDIHNVEQNLILLASYPYLLDLEEFAGKDILNIHGSLLPKWRGYHSIFWSIINGESEQGFTIHKVNQLMDSGDIIYQEKFSISDMSVIEIIERIDLGVLNNTANIIEDYLFGKIIPFIQNEMNATYGCKRNLHDTYIDFNQSVEYLNKFFRGLTTPYPLPRFNYKGKIYEVSSAAFEKKEYVSMPGRVVFHNNDFIFIRVNNGFIKLKELKLNGLIIDKFKVLPIGARLID